jgi:hypothetical protein
MARLRVSGVSLQNVVVLCVGSGSIVSGCCIGTVNTCTSPPSLEFKLHVSCDSCGVDMQNDAVEMSDSRATRIQATSPRNRIIYLTDAYPNQLKVSETTRV